MKKLLCPSRPLLSADRLIRAHKNGVVFAPLRLVYGNSIGEGHIFQSLIPLPAGAVTIRQHHVIDRCLLTGINNPENPHIAVHASLIPVISGDRNTVSVPKAATTILQFRPILPGGINEFLKGSVELIYGKLC